MLSPFLRWCLPGQLVEESVPLVRHWSGRRRRPWHHPQVCRGQGIRWSKNPSVKSLWFFLLTLFVCIFSSGWGQHDRVGQRCDWQRRPPLRHRPASHSRCRSNPETFAGPLRRPLMSVLYPPISATQHSSHQSGHFFWVGGQGSQSEQGRGEAGEDHHFLNESEAALCLDKKLLQNFILVLQWPPPWAVTHQKRSRADSTSVNIPDHWTTLLFTFYLK